MGIAVFAWGRSSSVGLPSVGSCPHGKPVSLPTLTTTMMMSKAGCTGRHLLDENVLVGSLSWLCKIGKVTPQCQPASNSLHTDVTIDPTTARHRN
jgi:hypothetical protein